MIKTIEHSGEILKYGYGEVRLWKKSTKKKRIKKNGTRFSDVLSMVRRINEREQGK